MSEVSRIQVEIFEGWRRDCVRQCKQKEASVVTSLALLREPFLACGHHAFGGRKRLL